MRKIASFFLILAFAAPLAAAPELSMTYDQVMTTPKGVFVTKVWIKGGKKRTETDRPGGQEIDILEGNTYTQIFPDLGIARRMPLAMGASAGMDGMLPAAVAESKDSKKKAEDARPIGTETVANLPCKVYEFKSDGGGTTRVWISDILPFPVKWEEDEKRDGKFSYEIRNLKVAADIPDDLFKVPAGIKLMDQNLQEINK
jgi:outer membrane lipoprotein-sorting protein